MSFAIYILSIFFMRSYINLGEFDALFIMRILVIVAGSWGLIFVAEELYRRLYPSMSKRVAKLVDKDGDVTNLTTRPLLSDNLQNDTGYDD